MIALDLDLSFDDFGDVDQARLRLQTCTRLLSSPPLRSRLHCPYTVHAPRDPRAPWVGVRKSRNLIAYSTYRTTCSYGTATARRPGNLSDARGTHMVANVGHSVCTVHTIRLCTTLCNKRRLQGSCSPLCREPRAARATLASPRRRPALAVIK